MVPMGTTDAGIVDAAEGQIAVQGLHQTMVDAGASRGCLPHHLVDICLLAAPDVQGQRLGLGINAGDHRIQLLIADYTFGLAGLPDCRRRKTVTP